MSHVLLVSPASPFLVDSRTFPPLGLLYLGAALEANGHTVKVIDLAFDTLLTGHNPDLIGIMCLTPHFPQMKKLMADLRWAYGDTPIAVGGPHFSTIPEDGARIGADAVCVGDGEDAIVEMANDPSAMRNAKLYKTPGGLVDVDKYPIPARHLLPIQEYRYQIGGLTAATLISQRGCP